MADRIGSNNIFFRAAAVLQKTTRTINRFAEQVIHQKIDKLIENACRPPEQKSKATLALQSLNHGVWRAEDGFWDGVASVPQLVGVGAKLVSRMPEIANGVATSASRTWNRAIVQHDAKGVARDLAQNIQSAAGTVADEFLGSVSAAVDEARRDPTGFVGYRVGSFLASQALRRSAEKLINVASNRGAEQLGVVQGAETPLTEKIITFETEQRRDVFHAWLVEQCKNEGLGITMFSGLPKDWLGAGSKVLEQVIKVGTTGVQASTEQGAGFLAGILNNLRADAWDIIR